ncbi:cation efflux protein [Rhizoclosmatium globosum]|uniref:Cation efflux protein n=1 Tax=Rhizoclosmatium globosum TaxID=329046 RepID=A0A1Y2CN24_9FUNG|nr:cation efflux protein [Rhizoclosmatium globosum]|eukprot:ORY48431.1 cation efflux protein [Rhizoclosmatium globosum]
MSPPPPPSGREDGPSSTQTTTIAIEEPNSLLTALFLCLVFFVVELVAGYVCGSLAILSDAFHLLSDVAGFGVSLFALGLSAKGVSKEYSFGYKRIEVLGAVGSTLSIWIITLLLSPTPIDAWIMFWTALFGVGVNIALAFTLHGGHDHSHGHGHDHSHGHGHGHSHGHSHDESTNSHSHSHSRETRKKRKNAKRGTAIHVISDLISSIGVLLASIILLIKPEWTLVDPLCTFFFSVLVFGSTWGLMKRCFGILMESVPSGIDLGRVEESLKREVDGIVGVEKVRIWSLSQDVKVAIVEVKVESAGSTQIVQDGRDVVENVKRVMKEEWGVEDVTVQVNF